MRVVNDRRGSTRVAVRGEALVHAPHGAVRCRCLDISPSGMSVVCPQAIKPKQRVRIESSFKGQRLVLEAVVVRRNRTRDGHVLGVRFEGTTATVRDRLHEVLRSMQVQAALAMQACAIVDRLPVLQIPEPEPEPATEKTPAAASPTPVQAGAAMPRSTPRPMTPGGTQQVPVVDPPRPFEAGAQRRPPADAPIVGGARELPVMGAPRARVETPVEGGTQELPVMGTSRARVETPSKGGTQELPAMESPWARVAVPVKGGTQELPAMGSPRARAETPVKGGTQELPVMGTSQARAETPVKGGTQELPAMESPWARVEVPVKGGTQELPAMETPGPAMPRAAQPSAGAAQPMPRPRIATPRPRVATPRPGVGQPPMPRPRVATPAPDALARRAPAKLEAPERLDSTMLTPPSQRPSARWPGGGRPVGLEDGWTEEELVTTHYRPSSDDSQPISVRRGGEPPASLVDAIEREGDGVEVADAVDRTEVEAAVGSFTVAEAPLPDWDVGAPAALAELVDTDAGSRPVLAVELELDLPVPPMLDRTMVGPRPPAIASLATSSSATAATEADDERLGPVRTGKTMVVHVHDLIAAYAPPLIEPELDLPEDTAPTTAPTTAPRLSDELQAALERLRRREEPGTPAKPAEAQAGGGEAAPRTGASARRRRRPGSTDVYATPGRDDTQVRALYHAALANMGDPDRGDGS